jgi:hypothetical protein
MAGVGAGFGPGRSGGRDDREGGGEGEEAEDGAERHPRREGAEAPVGEAAAPMLTRFMSP